MSFAFASRPQDSDETRLEKATILLGAGGCCVAGLVWSGMYLVAFGWGVVATLPLLFALIVGSALVVSHVTGDHRVAIYAQLTCILGVTSLIQWRIGGVYDSGVVLVWAFLAPIGALLFLSVRSAIAWFVLFLASLAITVAFDEGFAAAGLAPDPDTQRWFFAMNLGVASFVVFVFAGYFVAMATRERRRADALLLNTLPKSIADELKAGSTTIAEHYDGASVLFADIVGSTPMFKDLDPAIAVEMLNRVFTMFDDLVERHGAEKIRTIGDNYMVAAGVPHRSDDHGVVLAGLALDMVAGLERIPEVAGRRLSFRIGIHSGPMVAGVIGRSKFQYDLWGDTVNTAARMESTGEPGRVQVSAVTRALIDHAFECEPRGRITVKGRGEMETWFVVGRRARAGTPVAE